MELNYSWLVKGERAVFEGMGRWSHVGFSALKLVELADRHNVETDLWRRFDGGVSCRRLMPLFLASGYQCHKPVQARRGAPIPSRVYVRDILLSSRRYEELIELLNI